MSNGGSVKAVFAAAVLLAFGRADAQDNTPAQESPDKKWVYKCEENGVFGFIAETSSGEVAVDLSRTAGAPQCDRATVVWSPDSKRFAFNYSPPHVRGSTFESVDLFELRDGKWVELPALVEDPHAPQLVQLGGKLLPPKLRSRRKEANDDVMRLRKWIEPNTATVYAQAVWDDKTKAAYLFTIKFDAEGNTTVAKAERAPDK